MYAHFFVSSCNLVVDYPILDSAVLMGTSTIMISGPSISRHGDGPNCNALGTSHHHGRVTPLPLSMTLSTFSVVEALMAKT